MTSTLDSTVADTNKSEIPAQLKEWQNTLLDHIVAPKMNSSQTDSLNNHSDTLQTVETDPARLGAYQNNTRIALINSLQTTYPIILHVLGDRIFPQLAFQYVKKNPMISSDLNTYGEQLTTFLVTHPIHIDFPFLSDLAQLEWNLQQSYYANECSPISDHDWQQVLAMGAEEQSRITFTLRPDTILMQSHYPLHTLKDQFAAALPFDCCETSKDRLFFIIEREKFSPALKTIPVELSNTLRLIQKKYTLGELLHAEIEPTTLIHIIKNRWVNAINVREKILYD
ncbi:MAG: hypothetical protein ACI9Y1_003094 [Lentisphaeria bacterium]|jgi:hypothetical protein